VSWPWRCAMTIRVCVIYAMTSSGLNGSSARWPRCRCGICSDRHQALDSNRRDRDGRIQVAGAESDGESAPSGIPAFAIVVARFVSHYNTLYGRLHDMRVSEELKAEHFIPEDVRYR
jgi:hypothetical protein